MEKAVDMPVAEAEKDKSQFVKNSVLYKSSWPSAKRF